MTVFESIADFEAYMPTGGHRGDFFFVRNNNLLTKVMLYEIQWVSADGNYCVIQTDSKKFAVKVSLKKLSERLPAMDFIQIHKSHIARLEGIESVDIKEHIVTISGQSLPLGRTYKDALLARLEVL
ncbi:MAG TPA: LytTR family DNA-binding domain-containing protein [Saprospiraceae bacterium]|nr:LytTR family DNA-binding domain-containing protein [Saprospiraceae bacterium]HMP25814.1 LytTR family DNA-binding domain-containing protein [Saprospiraceae bacterium]